MLEIEFYVFYNGCEKTFLSSLLIQFSNTFITQFSIQQHHYTYFSRQIFIQTAHSSNNLITMKFLHKQFRRYFSDESIGSLRMKKSQLVVNAVKLYRLVLRTRTIFFSISFANRTCWNKHFGGSWDKIPAHLGAIYRTVDAFVQVHQKIDFPFSTPLFM